MGPIASIDIAASRSPDNAGPILNSGNTARADASQATDGLGSSRGPGAPIAITQLHTAVSQLLQSVGGGLEDDKVLQMLIALIILLALLRESQGASASPPNALAPLATRGGPTQFVSFYSSSTTIVVEQTTTTMVFQAMDVYGAAADSGQGQSKGGQVDSAA